MKEKGLSPMMAHYRDMKKKYADCILFYRLGDFYEMFDDDAIECARVLDLTLTSKANGLDDKSPMCGVPYHAASTYIGQLVEKGYKVAICEQMGDPEKGKVMEREVVRIVTPGTLTDDELLDERKNNYLLCIYNENDKTSCAYVDISTGDFEALDVKDDETLSDLITRINPAEVIGNNQAEHLYDDLPIQKLGSLPKFNIYYDWAFSLYRARENMEKQFGGNYAKVYELSDHLTIVCGAVIEYLKETQKCMLGNINSLKVVRSEKYMNIDSNSRRNLELTESMREHKRYGSLLWLIDKTKTSMGARLLRKEFDMPICDAKILNERLDAVEELVKNIIMRDSLAQTLAQVRDIERLSSRLSFGRINPKELLSLKESLCAVPKIKAILTDVQSSSLSKISAGFKDFQEIANLIERAIEPECPISLKEGGYIRSGFNAQLDKYRDIQHNSRNLIKQLEAAEREQTGIKNLEIKSNRVFGYYIEVNRSQIDKVPLRYSRVQTVANNERYTTDELKEMETEIFNAEENAIKLENVLFNELKSYLSTFVADFQECAKGIALIDVYLSKALSAVKYNFSRPVILASGHQIKIEEGRHPVVEFFAGNGQFIANDTNLNCTTDRTMIITGPNMAGKSTYMRQVAIITFLAHIGSFVPAKHAEISLTDRIFTRVGASDDLVFGQSTFMVEMSEVAQILANATNKSLVLLDEIGRGTSTFDGLAIAWAVVEYVSQKFKCKTLFATHYHELTELEGVLDGVKNYKIAVKEVNDSIIFLRKIVRGGANKSFGIEVARLAGVPKAVLDRAKEISENLERTNAKFDASVFKEDKDKAVKSNRLANELLSVLKDIDINKMTPLGAFDTLNSLVEKAKGEK